jgi:hypothetical protein
MILITEKVSVNYCLFFLLYCIYIIYKEPQRSASTRAVGGIVLVNDEVKR